MFRSYLSAHLPSNKAGIERGLRVVNSATEPTAKLYIYDEIGAWGITAKDVVRALAEVGNETDLELHINSPGGDVFDGIAIYNALKAHAGTITAICDGLAASAASFIFQAASNRVMTPNGTVMIHDAQGLCVGNAEDMSKMVDLLNQASDNIASIYAARSDTSVEEWRAAMREERWYTADSAVAAGLADEVTGDAGESVATNSWDVRFFNRRPEPMVPTLEPSENGTQDDQDGKRTDLDINNIIKSLKEAWA